LKVCNFVSFIGFPRILLKYKSFFAKVKTDDSVMVDDDSTYKQILHPSAAFVGGTLVAAWRDSRSGDAIADIYAAISSDYGASWSANKRVDHAPAGYTADYPALATHAGNVYVIRHDDRNGDWDIYLTMIVP
jgi:hypothetical protein